MKRTLLFFFATISFGSCVQNSKTDNQIPQKDSIITQVPAVQPDKSGAMTAEGIDFTASGNEPFWGIEIGKNKSIHFKTPDGFELNIPVAERKETTDGNIISYSAKTEKGTLSIQIQKAECINDMSGEKSDYAVTVEIKNNTDKNYRTYKGCGRYLSAQPVTGNDADEHGCKPSAGYQWSVLKNNCIRIFEDGTRLNPLEAATDKTTAAYIVFSKDHSKAELFLPSGKSSILLKRKAEGQPWVNGEWVLIAWKGYVLKKNDKPVYGGM